MVHATVSPSFASGVLEDVGYAVHYWGVDEGLPNQMVVVMEQDHDGYLWIGTDGGLVRFDGLVFEEISLERHTEIQSITGLFCDSRGRLWIAVRDGSLILYEGAKLRLLRGQTDRSRVIWQFTEDERGSIWFAAVNGGELIRYRNGELESTGVIVPAPVRGLGFSAQGDLLYSSNSSALLRHSAEGSAFVDSAVGQSLFSQFDGAVRIVGSEGILRLDGSTPILEQPFSEAWKTLGITLSRFNGRDSEGTFWMIGYGDEGVELFLMSPDGEVSRLNLMEELERFAPKIKAGLPPSFLNSLLFGKDGSVWLATSEGLFQFRPILFRKSLALEQFETESPVLRIREDTADRLWFVSHGGSSWLRPDRAELVDTTIPGGFRWLTEGESVWVAPHTALSNWRFDPTDQRWEVTNRKIFPEAVSHLHLTTGGDLWVGTKAGVYLRVDDRFVPQGPEGPVRAIASDRQGRVYALLENGSLHCVEDGRWDHLVEIHGQKVHALAVDEDGTLWLAGERPALSQWKDGQWFSFDDESYDWPSIVLDVLPDDRGGLWLSTTNRGIIWLNRGLLDATAAGRGGRVERREFGINDGLPASISAGWGGGMCQTRRGTIWVSTRNGPAEIDLNAMRRARESTARQSVVIEDVWVDDESTDFSRPPGGDAEDDSSLLVMRPDQRRVEFAFTAPSFLAPEQIRFRYRLDGVDPDWVDGGTVRSTHYQDLSPGIYLFRVAATNSYGVWNEEGATLELVVLPAWWQRGSFKAAVVVLLLVATGGVGYWVTRGVRRRSDAQERFAHHVLASQEKERQRIAQELHDSLGHDLILIKQALDLHDLSHRVGKDVDDVSGSPMSHVADLMGDAIAQVRTITNDLSPPELGRLGLAAAVESMAVRAAEHTGIAVRCAIRGLNQNWSSDESINIYRIIQECLTNAVKHAEAQSIDIRSERRSSVLRIVIEDDGKGYNSKFPVLNSPVRGHGLDGLQKRARMLCGTLTIRSRPGKGTCCVVEIPLSNQ